MSENKKDSKVELMKGEEALLLDHDYDGIHELDHMLPRWWIWLFYITIIFAVWYSGVYLFGSGASSRQELSVAMKEVEALRPAPAGAGGADESAAYLAAVNDPAKVAHGKEVFAGKCVACHGDKGQGLIGPNLTDEYWIHGDGTVKDTAAVIIAGVAEKGMPPWGPVLTPDEMRDVVAFIRSIRGSNPAGAKAAQGDKQEMKD